MGVCNKAWIKGEQMADKLEFRSKLSGVLALAMEHEYRITCEEVEKYFEEDQLTQEQMELVFDYLLAQKVAVKGYIKVGGSVVEAEQETVQTITYTSEEEAYLAEYLTDLQAIRGEQDGELEALFQGINQGDTLAKSRVTELYLTKVVEIGKSMYHPALFIGDLIQEGNVSLMIALESLPVLEDEGKEGLEEYLNLEIRQGIQMLIEETVELKSRDKKMVQQVSDLDETITKLTDDLGRKVTVDELALYMEMSEEEILEILKLTGEDVEEESGETDASGLDIQVLDKDDYIDMKKLK